MSAGQESGPEDPQGIPAQSDATPSEAAPSDEDWAKDVLAVAAKLKFRPSLQDGVPVPATCTIEFVRGK